MAVKHFLHDKVTPVCLNLQKRGRPCTIAKLVLAKPLNQIVLAIPFRNRQIVQYVSLPPAALQFARQQGARLWLVRFDLDGRCLSFPLDRVEMEGWLKSSEGQPEFFVPLTEFQPIGWQDWDYVRESIDIDNLLLPSRQSDPIKAVHDQPQQLGFFEGCR